MTFFEQKVGEPKLGKDGLTSVRTVKVGNKVIGHIESPKAAPGRQNEAIYWTPVGVKLYSPGRLLAVSQMHIRGMEAYAVKKIGVRFPDGSSYLIALSEARVEKLASGCTMHFIPIDKWEVTMPSEDVRVANTMGGMRLAGSRKSSLTLSA